MNEREKNDPLREFGERLNKARAANQGPVSKAPDSTPSTSNALAFGWRVGIELVGAIVVAEFIGWAIDKWFGTRPWGMVVFFFLGVAAGMLNVYRAVTGMTGAVGFKPPPSGNALQGGNAPPTKGAGWDEDEED
ncbi:MAG TPA: AtpZ/AtpI family protein [Stellaceae bacterium]|jgi:ATP synthase protein I|nr:AtpZ/AtpI family protein [Stellaceae bacterium]